MFVGVRTNGKKISNAVCPPGVSLSRNAVKAVLTTFGLLNVAISASPAARAAMASVGFLMRKFTRSAYTPFGDPLLIWALTINFACSSSERLMANTLDTLSSASSNRNVPLTYVSRIFDPLLIGVRPILEEYADAGPFLMMSTASATPFVAASYALRAIALADGPATVRRPVKIDAAKSAIAAGSRAASSES